MTLSTTLEVAIGLILIYYALGLIVNMIMATIKDILDMRAETLEVVLKKFLQTSDNKLFADFRDHPLIQNLKPIQHKFLQTVNREHPKASEIPDTTFSLVLLNMLSSKDLLVKVVRKAIGQLVEEVDDETTRDILHGLTDVDGETLVDSIRSAVDQLPDGTTKERLEEQIKFLLGTPESQLDCIRAGIQELPDGETKNALLTLIDFNVDTIEEAQKRLENWYNDMMKNVSLLFKQNARKWVIGVSLLVTLILGADSVLIAQTLWKHPAYRVAVAEAVPGFVEAYGVGEIPPEEMQGLDAEKKIELIEERAADIGSIIENIEALDIPLTWRQSPPLQVWSDYALKALGLLITWLATAQGSSFWYDVLKKINPSSAPKKAGS
jgi:hypothetical protein